MILRKAITLVNHRKQLFILLTESFAKKYRNKNLS